MVARDGIEPPTPAFSGPLPMELSALKSAEPIEVKADLGSFGIIWDGFLPRLFPYCSCDSLDMLIEALSRLVL